MLRARLIVTMMFGALLFLGAMLALTADLISVDGAADFISCDSASDSLGAPSTWSWFPPGKVCNYPDGSTERPHWRGELAALSAIPLGGTLFVRALLRLDGFFVARTTRKMRKFGEPSHARAP